MLFRSGEIKNHPHLRECVGEFHQLNHAFFSPKQFKETFFRNVLAKNTEKKKYPKKHLSTLRNGLNAPGNSLIKSRTQLRHGFRTISVTKSKKKLSNFFKSHYSRCRFIIFECVILIIMKTHY